MIPHVAGSHGVAASLAGQGSRLRVLTWGLLGPGKGIELAIDAIALRRDRGLRLLPVAPAGAMA